MGGRRRRAAEDDRQDAAAVETAVPSDRISGWGTKRFPEEPGGIFCARSVNARKAEPDIAAGELLAPGGRWNNLINAIATYISGAELDRLSIRDFDNFDDTGVNWRIVEGYGATIAACADSLPVKLNCPVQRIDHSGKRLRIETPDGTIEADGVIVTLPTTVLAESRWLLLALASRKDDGRAESAAWSCRQAFSLA